MYIDSRLESLNRCKRLDDIADFLKNNHSHIIKYKNEIKEKIDEALINHNTYIHTDLLDQLFFSRNLNEVNDVHMEIIKEYFSSIKLEEISHIEGKYDILLLLLTDKEKLSSVEYQYKNIDKCKYNKILKHLLQFIFDAYIPFEDPIYMINTSIDEKGHCLNELISEPFIFPLANIYNMEEYRYEAFMKFKYHHDISTKLIFDIDETSCKYSKYINDAYLYIYELIAIFIADGDKKKILTVAKNLSLISNNDQIVKLILLDALHLSMDMMDIIIYNELRMFINKLVISDIIVEEENDEIYEASESVMDSIAGDGLDYVFEAYKKSSQTLHNAQNKIYKLFKKYKDNEDKVDSQLTGLVKSLGSLFVGDVRTEIIEGKKYTVIGLVKKVLRTAAIFSIGPIKGLFAFVARYALRKNITISERRKLIIELERELEIIEEKLEDAKSDGNRKAKYALMRTTAEIKEAIRKIRLGLDADEATIRTAKKFVGKG